MSAASDLIERMERETGRRIEDDGGDNAVMAGLFGIVSSRMLSQSPSVYREGDEVAAGYLVLNQLSSERRMKVYAEELAAQLVEDGMPPGEAAELVRKYYE